MQLSAIDSGDGPAAVLLHGQPGNAADWAPVTERLRERMRTIVPDRPGYGRTGGRAQGFHENAAAVVGLLDELGVEAAVLVGHSWGTGVALALAIRFPQRVRALVLAAPVSPDLPPGAVDRFLAHPLVGAPATRLGFALAGAGLALPPVRGLAHKTVPALSPTQVASTAAAWRSNSVWRSFYAEQRALVTELPLLAPHLPTIDRPTTILYGTRDRISPPAHARSLARALASAQLVPAEQASHMLPQQRPQLVAEAIGRAAT